jgi:hypothetical protein
VKDMYMVSAGSYSTESANSLLGHGQTFLPIHWNQTGRGHDTWMFALPMGSIETSPFYMVRRDSFMFLLTYGPNVLTVRFWVAKSIDDIVRAPLLHVVSLRNTIQACK